MTSEEMLDRGERIAELERLFTQYERRQTTIDHTDESRPE